MLDLKVLLLVLPWHVWTVTAQGQFETEILNALDELAERQWYLSRAVMMQQVAMEEYRRSVGDSGLTVIRNYRDGKKPYHANSHTSWSAAASHNHPNHPRTCGMGELGAVLNGVHFRSRHNDYLLVQPSKTSGEYRAVQDIPFPAVPPSVLAAGSVSDQVTEMKAWFKAWATGDSTLRDYRQYFKPVLCYLEGAWTQDKLEDLTEPYRSEFHSLNADSWFDLQDTNHFTSWTGDQDYLENYAHLPMALVNVTDDGGAEIAQWNYRILCHPIQGGVELSDLQLVDDLSSRLTQKTDKVTYSKSRAARFSIVTSGQSDVTYNGVTPLDRIMAQIPGMDNYGARITDEFMGQGKLDAITGQPLNAAYYHRSYLLRGNPAYAGFNDRNLFVAQTTQPKVTPIKATFCPDDTSCAVHVKRVSFAVPLELVFLTPLQSWNPYNIQYKGEATSTQGATVTANNRNGEFTQTKAYKGTNSKHFFHTPSQFFSGGEIETEPADSKQTFAAVLDPNGQIRNVTSSGVRILLPEIEGVGVARMRYPVYPLHEEGSTAWKEMQALREMVMSGLK